MDLNKLSQEDYAAFDIGGENLNESFRSETRAILANRNIIPRVSPSGGSHQSPISSSHSVLARTTTLPGKEPAYQVQHRSVW